jgi:hypothetical protein
MDVDVGDSGGVREVLMVVALAAAGLLLAGLAAFTPWYASGTGGAQPHVVELRSPGLTGNAG